MLAVITAGFKLKLCLVLAIFCLVSLLTRRSLSSQQLDRLLTYNNIISYAETIRWESGSSSWEPATSQPTTSSTTAAAVAVENDTPHPVAADGPADPIPAVDPYFREPGTSEVLAHFDARYFRELGHELTERRRVDALRQLLRSYVATTTALNLTTWIAHRTLLGWWWNGLILPWDRDLDVQVDERTLFSMAEEWNTTEFEWSWEEGGVVMRTTYVLDVNSHVHVRERGTGDNVIDARWIDTSNGMFIDITGLSPSPRANPESSPAVLATEQPNEGVVWKCKNDEHVYTKTDIWPLQQTTFEGVQVAIPSRFRELLVREYGADALQNVEYKGYHWNGKVWMMGNVLREAKERANAKVKRRYGPSRLGAV